MVRSNLYALVPFLIASCLYITNTAFTANAQSIHLPPAHLPPLKSCDDQFCDLLTIVPMADSSAAKLAAPSPPRVLTDAFEVRVFREKIWFIGSRGETMSFELAGRTLRDLALELRDAFPQALILTKYPEYDGRYLEQLGPTAIGEGISVKGDLGGVQVHSTVGAIFGLSEVDELTGESQLLSNGGLQLDVVGQYPFSKNILGRARMTFTSNEPQAVGNAVDSSQVMAEAPDSNGTLPSGAVTVANTNGDEPDIQSLISNTERFSMGILLEWFFVNESRKRISTHLEYEIAWNALSDVPIPTFRLENNVGNTVEYSIFDIYPAERIGEVRQNLNKVEPISTILAGMSLHFPSSNNTSVHILTNVGWTEQIIRQLSFQVPLRAEDVEENNLPDPSTLVDETIQDGQYIWRVAIGMTLGSTFDLRADAVGPIAKNNNFDPLLRIVLSKKFPLR